MLRPRFALLVYWLIPWGRVKVTAAFGGKRLGAGIRRIMAEKNLKIMGTIDSRRIDRPGIIRMLRNQEVQRMWDQVVTHEFPMSQAEEAFKISATQQCGKILLYPHRK